MTRIALLNIGTELLKGRTVNTNASDIGRLLRRQGYELETTLVIHDEESTIQSSIESMLRDYHVVLVTGGLGPTKDDITKKVLLKVFGGEMMLHQPTMDHIKALYERFGRKFNEANRNQAMVPSSCEVMPNPMGTAPAMAFRREGHTLISMPGVPFEMRSLMKNQVIPWLQQNYEGLYLTSRMIRTHGIPESHLAAKMEAIEGEIHPDVRIAYLPSLDGVKMDLSIVSTPEDEASDSQLLKETQANLAEYLEKYVYSLEDLPPDAVLAAQLKQLGLTFATAESMTGGAIAAKMVSNSGVSEVFKGGIVSYMTDIKIRELAVPPAVIEEVGVVSEAVANLMAAGARKTMGADIAVSITGIAEAPRNAPPHEQPQAWIGYADKHGAKAIHTKYFQDRITNIERAAYTALVFVLQNLNPEA